MYVIRGLWYITCSESRLNVIALLSMSSACPNSLFTTKRPEINIYEITLVPARKLFFLFGQAMSKNLSFRELIWWSQEGTHFFFKYKCWYIYDDIRQQIWTDGSSTLAKLTSFLKRVQFTWIKRLHLSATYAEFHIRQQLQVLSSRSEWTAFVTLRKLNVTVQRRTHFHFTKCIM